MARVRAALLDDDRAWVATFVEWYNTEHRHSAIRFVTPAQRHYGREEEILQRRRMLYEQARHSHPERWTRNVRNCTPVATVHLNPHPHHKAKQTNAQHAA